MCRASRAGVPRLHKTSVVCSSRKLGVPLYAGERRKLVSGAVRIFLTAPEPAGRRRRSDESAREAGNPASLVSNHTHTEAAKPPGSSSLDT